MMTGKTKMIIITSNEDIIHQFSSKQTKNTQIIDLDNDKQINLMGTNKNNNNNNNNNEISLALLTELSELNPNNDQVFKRALHSPDHSRTKPVKTSKKSIDLTCNICGDRAIGFNYDVLSCASCKAFFRRNANQSSEKIRCLTGHGQCSVAIGVRRKCPKCRLDRCFGLGMRKDFILSEEEKQRRRKRLEENRNNTSKRLSISEPTNSSCISNTSSNCELISPTLDELDHLLMEIDKVNNDIVLHESNDSHEIEDASIETLSVDDWGTIQSVRSSFLSFFQDPPPARWCNNVDVSDRTTALIAWSQFVDQIALRFINYFRQIEEFENFHADDRFNLIKYNLLSLFPIGKCFNYKPIDDCSSQEGNEEAEGHRRFFMLCNEPESVMQSFKNMTRSLVKTTEQDPTFISLLLVILLFSQGLSMSQDEPSLEDPLAVYRAQSRYTEVLWNYMVNIQGETKTYERFTQLLTIMFRIQSTAKTSRDFFRRQFATSNMIDRLAPLMQTFLHIS